MASSQGTSDIDADTVDGQHASDLGSVEASETDDGSDVTQYRAENNYTDQMDIVNISGSGVLLGGLANDNEDSGEWVKVDITVDGGTTWELVGTDEFEGGTNESGGSSVYIPPVQFETSLVVTVKSDRGSSQRMSGHAVVKQ